MDQSVGRPPLSNKIDNYSELLSPKAKKKVPPLHPHVGGMHPHHQTPTASTSSGSGLGVGFPAPTPSGETSSPPIDNVETITLHYSFEGDMTKASVALFDEHIIYPDPNKDISKNMKDYTVPKI